MLRTLPGVNLLKLFSLSLTIQTNKKECLRHWLIFTALSGAGACSSGAPEKAQ